MMTKEDFNIIEDIVRRASRDPWDSEYRKIWLATYSASFARMVHDRIAEGRGAPDENDLARFEEESSAIGKDAAEANHRAEAAKRAADRPVKP